MKEGKLNKKANSDKGKKKKLTAKTELRLVLMKRLVLLQVVYSQLDTTKSIEEGHQDYVMEKVGEIIAPMKENFIVAYLACAYAKEENMVVPKPIAEFREKHGIKSLHLAATEEARKKDGGTNGANSSSSKGVKIEDKDNGKDGNASSMNRTTLKVEDTTNTNSINGAPTSDVAVNAEKSKQSSVVVAREGKFAAMEARKRSIEGKVKKVETKSTAKKNVKKDKPSTTITVKDSKGCLVKVLDDDAEEMDCEFLNTRQLFFGTLSDKQLSI